MNISELTNGQLSMALKNKEFNVIRVLECKEGKKWVETETETDTFTEKQKERFLAKDTLSFFRNLGGLEYVKQGTFKGIGATISESTSPCRTERKTTYIFF